MTLRSTVAACAAAALVSISAAATASAQDAHEIKRGSMVNITACVVRSLDNDDDKFLLTNIVDVPAHPPLAGPVVYWVDETDYLEKHVGKRIRFNARIEDVDRKEMEVKPGKGVQIEGVGTEIMASAEAIGLTNVSTSTERTIRTTLVELDIDEEPTVVSESCPKTTVAAETAAATASAESRVTEVTSAAAQTTVATPDVRVERETAVTMPETRVERETTTAVVETPAPAVTGTMTERRELPRTASPLPLVALVGFGSLLAAGALRARR